MEFIETPTFTRYLGNYLDDEGYRRLQTSLMANPEAGDIIPDSGGFRKVRWQDLRRKKGKRGGLRIIYYLFPEEAQIWFVTVYDKDQKDDLTPAEKRALHRAITTEKAARVTAKKTQR